MRRACLILMLVALMLGGSTGVAFAGHALDSPVATTNPGDFWVSGNMDCDGTSVWDGVATFNANAIFTLDTSVGNDLVVGGGVICNALTVQGFAAVATTLTVVGDVKCDSLYVGSNLTVVGALEGARNLIVFDNSNANRTTDEWLFTGKISGNTTRGLGFIRAGSVIGITGGCYIDSYTPTATLDVTVYIDGSEECQARWTIDAATAWKNWHVTFPRGDHTFTADQFISVHFDVTGTAQWDYATCAVEVQVDD